MRNVNTLVPWLQKYCSDSDREWVDRLAHSHSVKLPKHQNSGTGISRIRSGIVRNG